MFIVEWAKDGVYRDGSGQVIDLTVKFLEFNEPVRFAATPTDPEEYGRQLYANAVRGDYGPVAPYTPPPPYVPTAQDNKNKAVSLLSETDWTAAEDVGNPQIANPYLVNQAAFLSYRSAVRNIAINPQAGNIQWPTKPIEQWSNN
jgi:hypothetical protein